MVQYGKLWPGDLHGHNEVSVLIGIVPFVINRREEINQAMYDYSNKRNGIERAKGWSSEIAGVD